MTHFNESKLSRIIARRIIVPEDRSQLLPLCTPIYAPTYNGVRASRVTVINPNTNSFNIDNSLPNTVSIGTKLTKIAAALNPLVEKEGNLDIDDNTGIATGFSSSNYIAMETPYAVDIEKIHVSGMIPEKFTSPIIIVGVTSKIVESITVQPNGNITLTRGTTDVSNVGKAKLGSEFHMDLVLRNGQINVTLKHLSEDNEDLMETFLPDETVTLISFGASSDASYSMDLSHAYFMIDPETRVPFFNDGRQVTNPRPIKNTFDIDMSIPLRRTYFVPHEVDLETDVNLMDMIKSDFAVQFKKAVSNEILRLVIANKANITKLNMGTDVATAVGTVIADNILNGTGQKYSIYKYDNGAPVSYIKSSEQPNIDDLALENEKPDALLSEVPQGAYKRQYAVKDDVDVPALYYIEQPTLILDADNFTDYQTGLCSGAIREYADKTIHVDTTKVDISGAGQGIFGTNDTFAVAFTEPKIKVAADKDFYADNICIEIYFGVTLVHTDNLRLFT